MAEIVNLNRFRKDNNRRKRAEAAAENRVRHGRTRAEREAEQAREEKRRALVEGHRLERPDEA